MADDITINIVEPADQSVFIGVSSTTNSYVVDNFLATSIWGNIVGILSAQPDLWAELSAKALSSQIVPTIVDYLSTAPITVESLNTKFEILSAGVNLFDIFITSGKESQTLSYDPQTYNLSISLGNTVNLSSLVETDSQTLFYNITGEELFISSGNSISLSALSYRNFNIPLSSVQTIQEFTEIFTDDIYPGYTVKLYSGRVYAFAGTDKKNPNHYLEVNTNPYKPIYREISLSGTETVIDNFFLGDFKTAKYNLQVETNFNNEIYYSEINVVGSVGSFPVGAASEYGQIFTNQLALKYDVTIDGGNNLYFILHHNSDSNPNHKYLVKGHRTNFHRI